MKFKFATWCWLSWRVAYWKSNSCWELHIHISNYLFFHLGLQIVQDFRALEDAHAYRKCRICSICECVTTLHQHTCRSCTELQYRWTCHSHSQTCWKCFLKVGTSLCLPQESHPKPDGCRHHASKPAELSLAALKVTMVHHHGFKHPPGLNQLLVAFYLHTPFALHIQSGYWSQCTQNTAARNHIHTPTWFLHLLNMPGCMHSHPLEHNTGNEQIPHSLASVII